MNPPIPYRQCYFCDYMTNDVQFVKGIAHKRCYDQWSKNRVKHARNEIKFGLKKNG